MATKAAAGSADGNILKQTAQAEGGDGGAAIAMYQAFDAGFKGTSKPGMDFLGAQYAKQQGVFNNLMENKPPLESVPLLEDTQLAGNENVVGMEGLMKEVSGLYQEQARILSKNKGDMAAQKKITEAAGYIQNVDAGNKQLAQLKMGNFEIDGQYNDMLNPTQKGHLQGIHLAINGQDQTGIKIEYPKEDGYRLKVTMPDGTIYDKNNPLPTPQGEYKNGSTAAMKFYNDKREKGSSATAPMTKEGAANQFLNTINDLKSDANPDAPATANEKMSMFFTDIVDDGEDLTYANAFASGKLPKEFYEDENGDIMTYDKREYDAKLQEKGMSPVQEPTKPAFDENGNFQWTKEEATDFLRQKTGLNHNMKNMSKWYGGAVADIYNEQYNVKADIKGTYLRGFDGTAEYKTKPEMDKIKTNLYTNMLVAKSVGGIDNSRNLIKTNPAQAMKNLTQTFAGTGINIGPIKDKSKPSHVGVIIGKERRLFDLSTTQGFNLFTEYLSGQQVFKQMSLGGNPQDWTAFNGDSLKAFDTRAAQMFQD